MPIINYKKTLKKLKSYESKKTWYNSCYLKKNYIRIVTDGDLRRELKNSTKNKI